jgi:hypothetical protein
MAEQRLKSIIFAISLSVFSIPLFSSENAFGDLQLSGPYTAKNLSVYFIYGRSLKEPKALNIVDALRAGYARIDWPPHFQSFTIANLSEQNLFVSSGTLLKGGPQDQVVAWGFLAPSGASESPLNPFSTDPVRSIARSSAADGSKFSTDGTLLPSRMAELSLSLGSSESPHAIRLRQLGVWMGSDDIRATLSRRINVDIDSSRWPTSLPLALENNRLREAQQIYIESLLRSGSSGNIVGVAFAINDHVDSAQVYSSNDLFQQMWPALLRRAATEAIANKAITPPSGRTTFANVMDFIAAGDQMRNSRSKRDQVNDEAESSGLVLSREIQSDDGNWVNRTYISTRSLSASIVESVLLATLASDGIAEGKDITNEDPERSYAAKLLSEIADDDDDLLKSIRKAIDKDDRARPLIGGLLDHTELAVSPPVTP